MKQHKYVDEMSVTFPLLVRHRLVESRPDDSEASRGNLEVKTVKIPTAPQDHQLDDPSRL